MKNSIFYRTIGKIRKTILPIVFCIILIFSLAITTMAATEAYVGLCFEDLFSSDFGADVAVLDRTSGSESVTLSEESGKENFEDNFFYSHFEKMVDDSGYNHMWIDHSSDFLGVLDENDDVYGIAPYGLGGIGLALFWVDSSVMASRNASKNPTSADGIIGPLACNDSYNFWGSNWICINLSEAENFTFEPGDIVMYESSRDDVSCVPLGHVAVVCQGGTNTYWTFDQSGSSGETTLLHINERTLHENNHGYSNPYECYVWRNTVHSSYFANSWYQAFLESRSHQQDWHELMDNLSDYFGGTSTCYLGSEYLPLSSLPSEHRAGLLEITEVAAAKNSVSHLIYTVKCCDCGQILTTAVIPDHKDGLSDYPELDGQWYYYLNNEVCDITTVASNSFGWWYVNHGRVDFSYTGLANNNAGWWYVENGQVKFDYNGLASNEAGWFYVRNSMVDFEYNGLVQNDNGFWYCRNGRVDFDANTLILYDSEWFCVSKGKIDTTFSGLVDYDGSKFIVAAGQLQTSVNGLWQNARSIGGDDKWYFFAAGQAQTQYTGLALYDGQWFYVIKGELAVSYTGMVEYDGAEFYVVNGMLR